MTPSLAQVEIFWRIAFCPFLNKTKSWVLPSYLGIKAGVGRVGPVFGPA